ncbi:unnamed protein product [Protopolystoma xenopodis]|uniref:DJ-1/PfpI domain-containing protein n=1 Tax=Protopolystoma xenopodis TaxID=117903 RepID=A0A3S5CLL8_9PLAT|nr:unnamed protein product [Protopolystoma xenopodis]
MKSHNICLGQRLTSYPSMKDKFDGYVYVEEPVVVDGKLVTSRGPGTAIQFALMLVELLVNKETREKLSNGMLL